MEQKTKVVLGLIKKDGSFLLIKRRKPHLHLEWAFPGGIPKLGETDEQAVVREVKEEVAIDVRVVGKLLERKHPDTFVTVAYFNCEMMDINQQPQIGEEYEISEIAWIPRQEVLDHFTSDVHPLIREFILNG